MALSAIFGGQSPIPALEFGTQEEGLIFRDWSCGFLKFKGHGPQFERLIVAVGDPHEIWSTKKISRTDDCGQSVEDNRLKLLISADMCLLFLTIKSALPFFSFAIQILLPGAIIIARCRGRDDSDIKYLILSMVN